jgi:sulfite reductase (NADPH) flavoprotein alpha-component
MRVCAGSRKRAVDNLHMPHPVPAPGSLSLPALPDPARESALLQLAAGLDAAQLRYLAGFLAGVAAERERTAPAPATGVAGAPAPAPAAQTASAARATVLFASQTGNGRRVAEKLHRQLESQGLAARLVNVADYRQRDLAAERLLYVVASTHGDGDPPDDARVLIELLASRKAPRIEQLAYSVLALGDSSYPKYCETGRLLDRRLAELGARRLADLIEADVDFQATADAWTQRAIGFAREQLQSPHIAIVSAPPPAQAATADRDTPVDVELLNTAPLTARGSERSVHHIELQAPAPQLAYEPGDAVGIWHANPADTVTQIAAAVQADPATVVTLDGRSHSLADWLASHREITRLSRPFLDAHARRAGSAELERLRDDSGEQGLRALLRDWQPIDLLQRFPAQWSAEELVQALRPLTPRLYSIASSRAAVGDELHLTVAAVEYQRDGQPRFGAASQYLTRLRAADAPRIRAYIEPNPRFRLPEDSSRDIIMIGPGTGVAPFRGFLQHRIEQGASGRNWLVFGGRHLRSDFLYQTEWLEARRNGTLHRLDVAFSRDQADKVYVQDRIREHGTELLRWLDGGAHLYVCGDAQRMAQDVHAALRDVLVNHGGRSVDNAEAELSELAAARRYCRDVY